jgi:cytochrome c-type biogenesis protein CcmH
VLRRVALAMVAAILLTGAAAAPSERLADPAQEARARALFHDVRCLVCQSESIDESDADLAHDLRQLIRSQVAAGRSDADIRAYLVSRYGQFVLLAPRFDVGNAILWLGPLLVVVAGGAAFALRRRAGTAEPTPLSVEEETEISDVLQR